MLPMRRLATFAGRFAHREDPEEPDIAFPVQTTMASPATDPEFGLRHQLNAAQMTMVAVGGSIGTGLLLGTAAAIELAGPAVILTFALAAFICWTVALALGELASTHPAAGAFGLYGDLYLNAWAGFVSRAGYWAFWQSPSAPSWSPPPPTCSSGSLTCAPSSGY